MIERNVTLGKVGRFVGDVHPWLMSRRQLVRMVRRDTRVIEEQGEELARAARREKRLNDRLTVAMLECERLRRLGSR